MYHKGYANYSLEKKPTATITDGNHLEPSASKNAA